MAAVSSTSWTSSDIVDKEMMAPPYFRCKFMFVPIAMFFHQSFSSSPNPTHLAPEFVMLVISIYWEFIIVTLFSSSPNSLFNSSFLTSTMWRGLIRVITICNHWCFSFPLFSNIKVNTLCLRNLPFFLTWQQIVKIRLSSLHDS